MIISGEDISILSSASLVRLKEFLLQYDFEIVPMLAIRSPYEFHCSVVQSSNKTGLYADFLTFESRIQYIKNIKEVFDNVRFYPFKTMCTHSLGPVGFLLEEMGVSCDEIEFHTENVSKANTPVRIQYELNKKNPSIINGKSNNNFKHISIHDSGYFQTKFFLTEEEYQSIKDSCDEENKLFEEFLGSDFKDTEIKFSDPNAPISELANYLAEYSPPSDLEVQFLIRCADFIEAHSQEGAFYMVKILNKIAPQSATAEKKLLEYYKKYKQ